MKKAIIFDFDGVIGESEMGRFRFLQSELAKHGVKLEQEYIKKFVGLTTPLVVQNVLSHLITEDVATKVLEGYYSSFRNNLLQNVVPIEKTVSFIRNYNGEKKLAIASMGSLQYVNTFITEWEIASKFAVITPRDQIRDHKPHPEIYLKTAELLAVYPEECIAVEDSIVGATAAIRAKMTTYVLINSLNKREEFEGMNIAGFIENAHDWRMIE